MFCLASVWCLSFLIGVFLAYHTRDIVSPMMYMAPRCHISILCLGLIVLVPLAISAAAIVFSVPAIIYFIVFLDCVSAGYCIASGVFAFGTAGWLVLVLLMFSQGSLMTPKIWFYTQCLTHKRYALYRFNYILALATIVCLIDYFIISRFLSSLVI